MSSVINEAGELEKRPQFERHVDTQALIEYLRELPVGATVSYEELSKVIGTSLAEKGGREQESIKRRLYQLMRSVKRRLKLDHRVFIATVWGVGVKRIDDTETAQSLESGAQKIRREAARNLETARCINRENVDQSERPLLDMRMATYQVVAHCTSPDARKKLQGAVNVLPKDHFTNADLLRALQRPEGE